MQGREGETLKSAGLGSQGFADVQDKRQAEDMAYHYLIKPLPSSCSAIENLVSAYLGITCTV